MKNPGCMALVLGVTALLIAREYSGNQNKPSVQQYHQSLSQIQFPQRTEGEQAGYEWASRNELFDHDLCRGNSKDFIDGCHEYVEEAMISAGCNRENAWERCDLE